MHSIDKLAPMLRSLSIDQQSVDNGYAAAYAEIISAQSQQFTIYQHQILQRMQKPPFGWKVMQNQMVQNPEHQIIIEAIRCIT